MIRAIPGRYCYLGKRSIPPFSCICTLHYYDKDLLNQSNFGLF